MNVLLTGGAGYIGSHICNTLLDLGYKVSTIDNLSTGNQNLIPKKVDHINSDIADEKNVTLLFGVSFKTFSISTAAFRAPL